MHVSIKRCYNNNDNNNKYFQNNTCSLVISPQATCHINF